MKDIWYGLHVATYGNTFNQIKNKCQEAEKQGYDLFTIVDHLMNEFHPWQGPHPPECWTTLSGLAAVTSKIKLAPLVACYRYRHPTMHAKMVTTLDHISNGRALFGIGAGWHQEEFKGYFGEYPSNKERLTGLRETVEICKNMFSKEISSYSGELYKVDKVLNSPLPVQDPLPILIGGGGEKVTLKIAAKHADMTHFFAPAMNDQVTLKRKLGALRRHCDRVDRNFGEIRKGTWLVLTVDETIEGAEDKKRKTAELFGISESTMDYFQHLCGTPEMAVDRVREYIDLGFEMITFVITPDPTADEINFVAKKIINQI